MYLNGEADWNRTIPLDQMDASKLRDDYQNYPYLGTYYYVYQCEKPPLTDARVRKALSMALNRKPLVEQITKGGQIPGYTMVPKMAGYPGIKGNQYDVKAAQKLLADAGYPNGKGFPKLEILYNTHEGHKKIAEYVQQQWKENLGIDVTLINQEWATYLKTKNAGDFQIARAGWIGDYQDPNTFLDMFITGAEMNGGKYSNKKFDELIKKAATMKPGKDRFAALTQAEEIFITQDQGVLPIYTYTTNQLVDLSKWGGWYNNTMDFHPVKNVYPLKKDLKGYRIVKPAK